MQNVLLVMHLLVCLALVVTILLQRSEGGALGIGGGGAFSAGRGATNALARVTMGLAAIFFCTSLTMTALNSIAAKAPTEVESVIIEAEKERRKARDAMPVEDMVAPPDATVSSEPITASEIMSGAKPDPVVEQAGEAKETAQRDSEAQEQETEDQASESAPPGIRAPTLKTRAGLP